MNVVANSNTRVQGISVSTGPILPATTGRHQMVSVDLQNAKVLIVDDEPLVVRVVRRFLQSEGLANFIELHDSEKALSTIIKERPDVVLLDINMPKVSGLDILAQRRDHTDLQFTPFIILSSSQDLETKQKALELGANEFLAKPVEKFELTVRVRNALTLKKHFDHLASYADRLKREVDERTAELVNSRRQILQCLARASEYRDNETGRHVVRVGRYSKVIARELGLPDEFCEQIEMAAQLHDLGKIGIPDSILLMQRRYTPPEFDVMKRHCDIGCQILLPLAIEDANERTGQQASGNLSQATATPLMTLAARIAQTHHEKWNGLGYPRGLKGDQIPIEGRIVAVADVYDALCSARPYKEKFAVASALEIIHKDRGTHFDPRVADAFFNRIDEIEKIRLQLSDES